MAVVRSKASTVALVLETYRRIAELQHLHNDSLGLQTVGSLYALEQEQSFDNLVGVTCYAPTSPVRLQPLRYTLQQYRMRGLALPL